MKALLDTNVMVDVLQRREPWFRDGAAIFRAVADQRIVGCLTAKQLADLHFFARKQLRGEEQVDRKARQVIGKLLALFELIDTLAADCQNALGVENADYEDAILMESAVRAGMDCVVTRNPAHFRGGPIRVLSPAELAAEIRQPE